MKNFVQPGNAIDFVAGADLVSGQGLILGSLFGVVANDVLTGGNGVLYTEGVYELPKKAATAMTFGQPVEWKTADAKIMPATEGDLDAGYVVKAADAADATVMVKLSRP